MSRLPSAPLPACAAVLLWAASPLGASITENEVREHAQNSHAELDALDNKGEDKTKEATTSAAPQPVYRPDSGIPPANWFVDQFTRPDGSLALHELGPAVRGNFPEFIKKDENGLPMVGRNGTPLLNTEGANFIQNIFALRRQASNNTDSGVPPPAGSHVGLGSGLAGVGGSPVLGIGSIVRTPPPEVTRETGTTLIKLNPDSSLGYGLVGDSYAGSDKAKAVKFYTQALDLGAGSDVRYKRGLAAEKGGDYELANADARKVLQAEPSNASAHSLFMLTRGRPSQVSLLGAAEASARAVSEAGGRGTSPEAARGAGAPAEPGTDPDGPASGLSAEQIAAMENAALNARPVSARSAELTRDAKAALRVRDTQAALRLTEEALAADPSNVDARYVRATAFLQLREPGRAAFEASAGLELAPGNAPLLYTRAVANGRRKLWREAYADAEEAVRQAPRAGYAYQARAAANWALGRKAEMMADLRTAASLDRAYAAALQRATQLPSDVDPTLLFGDEPAPAARADPAAPASRPPYLFWAIGSLLAVIGLAPFLVPDLRGRITTVLRRGPAGMEDPPPGENGEELPPSGFWRRYEVKREIGAGGMGVVYEAWDRQLERRAAVKRMRDEIKNDRRERERFLQEARLVARLRHPNLVEIYSIEEDGPEAYLVFEFVEGRNLHELIQERGRLAPAEAREVFRGICAGVDYAHRQNIIHRDLKPANVIVQTEGPVKVMDFGIARQAQDALQRRAMTNTIIGTPQYMAPEQEEGVVCAQSDVYALGVCLYEALSGTVPFAGTAGAVTLAKRDGKYEPLARRVSDLPPALSAVVDRALDPDPARRPQSAAAFMKELDAAVAGVTA